MGPCEHPRCSCPLFRKGPDGRCLDCEHPESKHPTKVKKKDLSDSSKPTLTLVSMLANHTTKSGMTLSQTAFRLSNREANHGLNASSSSRKQSKSTSQSKQGTATASGTKVAGIILNVGGTETSPDDGVVSLNNDTAPSVQTLSMYSRLGLAMYQEGGVPFDKGMDAPHTDKYLRQSIPVLGAVDIETGEHPSWRSCNPPARGQRALTITAFDEHPNAATLLQNKLGGKKATQECIIVIATLEAIPVDTIYRLSDFDNYRDYYKCYNQLKSQEGHTQVGDVDEAALKTTNNKKSVRKTPRLQSSSAAPKPTQIINIDSDTEDEAGTDRSKTPVVTPEIDYWDPKRIENLSLLSME
ncbi:hypothetical protein V5O48_017610 [Marasmius crinis-equi]|uniref:Uncharacterized protein n=1 Tax=Marasmius crinis-equi TaxID=585013 RepID=A0ABR3ENH6_9AGAR